jgi:hypothetical protein
MATGVYNPWIERSLQKLAFLMPGRYAKFEASTGPIDSIDRYAYRTPSARHTPAGEREIDEATDAEDPTGTPDPGPEVEESEEPPYGNRTTG